jgi:hypothetical protein
MGARADQFLAHWKSEHVASVAGTPRLREAVRLVAMCREDAVRAGIPAHELRTAAPDGMIRNMLAALAATAPWRNGAEPEPGPEPEPQSLLPRLLGHLRIWNSAESRQA